MSLIGVAVPASLLQAPEALPVRSPWDGFPDSAARFEAILERRGQRIHSTFEVLDLCSKRTVNGVSLECVEQESRSQDTPPSRLRVVRSRHEWLSPEVPGALVRCERECGTTEHSGHVTEELVEFKAVR